MLHDQRASHDGDTAIGWGRATSTDLLQWRDVGVAIPAGRDEWIYSGCVAADADQPRSFFTLHRPSTGLQAQAAAIWNDGAR